MISLYPSHIPISFPYSHILPYPYIPHIHVSIFLSVPSVALPPVFSHFSFFCIVGGIGCRGVFFLWFFSVGSVDGFRPAFRSAPRPVFLVSFFAPSLVSFFGSFCSFRSSPRLSLRPFVSFVRLGVSWGGSCGGVWGGAVGLSSGVARCRGVCRVRCFCQLGFPHSLRSSPFVSSFLVAAAALFVFVSSCVSDGVAAERCVVAEMRAVWLGGAMGGSVMPCRVAERAVRDEGRDVWRDDDRAVFVSSI